MKKPKMAKKLQMEDGILQEMIFKYVVKHRTICLNTYVTSDVIFKMCYYINKLVEQDKKTGNKPKITIAIGSGGGSCYAGLELISLMEQLKEDGYIIETVVTSIAASMAFMIAICGSKGHRKIYRYGSTLFHQVSSGTIGTLQEMEESIAETDRLWQILKQITLKNTNLTDERLEQIKREKLDVWYSPQESKDFGITDIIL